MNLQQLFEQNPPEKKHKIELEWVIEFAKLCYRAFPPGDITARAPMQVYAESLETPGLAIRGHARTLTIHYNPSARPRLEVWTDRDVGWVAEPGQVVEHGSANGVLYQKRYTPYAVRKSDPSAKSMEWLLTYSTAPRTLTNGSQLRIPLYTAQALDEIYRQVLDQDRKRSDQPIGAEVTNITSRLKYCFEFLRNAKTPLFSDRTFTAEEQSYLLDNWTRIVDLTYGIVSHVSSGEHCDSFNARLREWLTLMEGPEPRTGDAGIIPEWNRARKKHLFGSRDSFMVSYKSFYSGNSGELDPMGLLNNEL